ncbi:synaptonemal complex protein 3-like [Tupaia chinensis]|uniref:synaptonemal complex protein 3-like n=1 Tax=Tupaia chinensis TaxID=246437 RepID=UPI0003C904DE|nr:synaptonemal complex protein 3-like [Tupaia chinensis]XP_006166756.1 synaptonemal complex protein 3-like [Tupaia chinensis]
MAPGRRKRGRRASQAPAKAQVVAASEVEHQEDPQLSSSASPSLHSGGQLSPARADSPGNDRHGESSPFTGTPEIDPGNEFQKILETFQVDLEKVLQGKRRSFIMNTNASVKSIQEKFEHVWKIQQTQREKLYRAYSRQLLTLHQEWELETQKVKEQEAKLVSIFEQLQEAFQQSRMVHSHGINAFKALFEEFLKRAEDLEASHGNHSPGELSMFRKEMAMLQAELMKQIEHQTAVSAKLSLHSLLFK